MTPVLVAVAIDAALVGLDFTDARYAPAIAGDWREDPRSAPLADCARQLAEYFAGHRKRFELPLAPRGTPFQRRVWDAIARIPCGATISYAELAVRSGAPGAARAAGAATGRNPLAIVIPCHRVIGAHGELAGYGGGVRRKARLLEHEEALDGALA